MLTDSLLATKGFNINSDYLLSKAGFGFGKSNNYFLIKLSEPVFLKKMKRKRNAGPDIKLYLTPMDYSKNLSARPSISISSLPFKSPLFLHIVRLYYHHSTSDDRKALKDSDWLSHLRLSVKRMGCTGPRGQMIGSEM